MTELKTGETASPPEDDATQAFVGYVPHDLKYSAEFEDSLMTTVLRQNPPTDGILVLHEDSPDPAVPGVSVRAADVPLDTLPTITEDELPLPLSDPRRIYSSPVPGIKLTHPRGYLEGGPGLSPAMDSFGEDFVATHRIATPAELPGAVARELAASVELLKARMQARRRATEKNAQIERQLETMVKAHNMELVVQRRLADARRAKKEAKEKRRLEREVG